MQRPWYTTNIPKQKKRNLQIIHLPLFSFELLYIPLYIILYPPMAHASQSFIIEKEWVESRTWPSHTKSIHPMVTQLPCLAAPMGQIPPDPVVPPRSPQGYLRAGHPLLGPIHPGESRKRMVKKHVGPMLILTMKSMKRLIDLFCCLGIQTSTPKKQSGTQKKKHGSKMIGTIIIYTSLQKPMFRDQHWPSWWFKHGYPELHC